MSFFSEKSLRSGSINTVTFLNIFKEFFKQMIKMEKVDKDMQDLELEEKDQNAKLDYIIKELNQQRKLLNLLVENQQK